MAKRIRNMIETFWSRVRRDSQDGCWEWQAGKSPKGYGAFYFQGRNHGHIAFPIPYISPNGIGQALSCTLATIRLA
jgi:hypothetical protein